MQITVGTFVEYNLRDELFLIAANRGLKSCGIKHLRLPFRGIYETNIGHPLAQLSPILL